MFYVSIYAYSYLHKAMIGFVIRMLASINKFTKFTRIHKISRIYRKTICRKSNISSSSNNIIFQPFEANNNAYNIKVLELIMEMHL